MKGKSVIVYYSWVGNTEVVAKDFRDIIGEWLKKIG